MFQRVIGKFVPTAYNDSGEGEFYVQSRDTFYLTQGSEGIRADGSPYHVEHKYWAYVPLQGFQVTLSQQQAENLERLLGNHTTRGVMERTELWEFYCELSDVTGHAAPFYWMQETDDHGYARLTLH